MKALMQFSLRFPRLAYRLLPLFRLALAVYPLQLPPFIRRMYLMSYFSLLIAAGLCWWVIQSDRHHWLHWVDIGIACFNIWAARRHWRMARSWEAQFREHMNEMVRTAVIPALEGVLRNMRSQIDMIQLAEERVNRDAEEIE